MFLSEGSCSAVRDVFSTHLHTSSLRSQRQTVYFTGLVFPSLILCSSFCPSWCWIWPINNVIPNHSLLESAVITSSIIWPHLLLHCKQPSLGQKTHTICLSTKSWWACTNIICFSAQKNKRTTPVTSLYSPSLLLHLSASLYPVNQKSISQHWSQEAVPHILAHLWEHFHSARWLTSLPRCDSSTTLGEIKTVTAKSNLQQSGRDNSSDQHVTAHLRLLLWDFVSQAIWRREGLGSPALISMAKPNQQVCLNNFRRWWSGMVYFMQYNAKPGTVCNFCLHKPH